MRITNHASRITVIDLNADLGEGAGSDAAVLPLLTSASIACGAHAGSPEVIHETIRLALTHRVAIGAHPSYPDREGFGRRPMRLSPQQLTDTVAEQIDAVAEAAREAGTRLQHVKPHGALYNQAAGDRSLARAIGEAVRRIDPSLIVVALAGSAMVAVLREMGLKVAQEAFIDRGYTPTGTLVPRGQAGAVITDAVDAARRAVRLTEARAVVAADGRSIRIDADTLCIHGDTPQAAGLVGAVRNALAEAGIAVRRMDSFL